MSFFDRWKKAKGNMKPAPLGDRVQVYDIPTGTLRPCPRVSLSTVSNDTGSIKRGRLGAAICLHYMSSKGDRRKDVRRGSRRPREVSVAKYKIWAIKVLRERLGISIHEAMDIVEDYAQGRPKTQ